MSKVLFFAHLRDAVGQESIESRLRENGCGSETADV